MNEKFISHVTNLMGVAPDYADYRDGNWIVGFKDKLTAYEFVIEKYLAPKTFNVFYSETLQIWCISNFKDQTQFTFNDKG